jgi:hypothetical protein
LENENPLRIVSHFDSVGAFIWLAKLALPIEEAGPMSYAVVTLLLAVVFGLDDSLCAL